MKVLKAGRFWVSCAVSLLCLWLAFRHIPVGEVAHLVAGAQGLLLLAAFAADFLAVVARSWRWLAVLLVCDTLARFPAPLRTGVVAGLFCRTLPVWYVHHREAVVAGWTQRAVFNAYRDCVLVHQDPPESCDDGGTLLPFKDALDRRVKLLRDHRMSFFAQTR